VIESGELLEAGDRYEVTGPMTALAIPTSLHASLLARLDRLAPVRELAQIAASLGRQFSHVLIAAVAGMPTQQVDDALQQLVNAGLIFRRGTPPDAEYTFKHALVQDAAYSTLLKARRRQIHARIVTKLEANFSELVQTQPVLLAQHCTEAGMIEKAIEYWLKAGQQSVARSAMTEGPVQLEKGLALVAEVSDATSRRKLELNLRITLGNALMSSKGLAAREAGDAFSSARQLCESFDEAQLGSVLTGQMLFRLVRGELERADHHAKEICDLGDSQNDPMWKCFGLIFRGNTCLYFGNLTQAAPHLENALAIWDTSFRATALTPYDPYMSSLSYYARTLLYLGYIDEARHRGSEALVEARRLSPHNLVFALCHAWYANWAIGSVDAMLRSAEEVVAISGDHGFELWLGAGKVFQGWCLSRDGQWAEGIPLLKEGIASVRATGCILLLPFFLTRFAEACRLAGQLDEGLERLDEAFEVAKSTQECWAEADMHQLRGTLLVDLQEHGAAEESYRRALAVAHGQSAKFWELRAATSLARLWRDQGKRIEARELLAPVYNWFTEGFDTPVLQDAKNLLDQL
jgi:tetratricopeptide (TPR) repeat protein